MNIVIKIFTSDHVVTKIMFMRTVILEYKRLFFTSKIMCKTLKKH